MLTLCDWEMALAAYAYEVHDESIMTDYSYDILGRYALARHTELPGFGSDTGQWVYGMDQALMELLWDVAQHNRDAKGYVHMPAIEAALHQYGVALTCCHGDYNCWDEVIL